MGQTGTAMLSSGAGNGVFRQYWPDIGMAAKAHLLLDRCPEILNQMKPIGHLFGLRRALSGSLGIETAAITADDLYRRAFLQPCFRAFNAAVIKDIDNWMASVIGQRPPRFILLVVCGFHASVRGRRIGRHILGASIVDLNAASSNT